MVAEKVGTVNMQNEFDGIVFSKDINFSYNVRNKCSVYGIKLGYSQSIKDLLLYLIKSDNGLIFIDYNCFSYIKLLKEYIGSEKSNSHIFIFLTDNKEMDIDIGKKSFVANLGNLCDIIPKIKYVSSMDNNLINVSKGVMYKNIIESLGVYGISPKLIGYSYMKECIVLGVESGGSILNFSNNIYPIIASKFHTCAGNVDKNIRTAIKKAYEKNPQLFEDDEISSMALTSAGFLNYIIEKVKIKCIQ